MPKLDLNLSQTVTLTNLELLAIRYPARNKALRTNKEPYLPIPGEILKAVPGTDGLCQISSLGRLIVTDKGGKRYVKKPALGGGKEKVFIDYMHGGRKTREQLSRLVLRVFSPVADKELKTLCALHGDCDITNCKLSNLRWATLSECRLHYMQKYPGIYKRSSRRSHLNKIGKRVWLKSKFSEKEIADAKLMIKAGIAKWKIVELTGMSRAFIIQIHRKLNEEQARNY
jgi:hypothetical protein